MDAHFIEKASHPTISLIALARFTDDDAGKEKRTRSGVIAGLATLLTICLLNGFPERNSRQQVRL